MKKRRTSWQKRWRLHPKLTHGQSWLVFFVVSASPSGEIPGWYLILVQNDFLPYSFNVIMYGLLCVQSERPAASLSKTFSNKLKVKKW